MSKRITYERHYRGIKINCGGNKGCYVYLLDRIYDLFENATDHHSKVFFFRFDLRFPQDELYPENNRIFRDVMAYYIKLLTKQRLDPRYMWVRERKSLERNQHYHGIILLNGHKAQSIYDYQDMLEYLWYEKLGIIRRNKETGLLDRCDTDDPGIMIRKDRENYRDAYEQAFFWSSYLAKVNTKEELPGIRNSGASERR